MEQKNEKKNAKARYLDKNSTKNGIMSLIAALLHKIGISSIWVLANFGVYLISYLMKYQDPKDTSLSLKYSYFFPPILTTTLTAFMPICGIVEFKLGIQSALILGALIIMSGYAILYISHNIFIDYFATFCFGIGLSISTTLSTKNAIMYFFKKAGAISGFLELISSGLSALHNTIGEKLTNPNHEDPPEGSEFFQVELASNVLNFYLFQLGTFGIATLLTLLFLVPYDTKAAKKLSKELKQKSKEAKEENNAINEDENKKPQTEGNLIIEDYSNNQNLKINKEGQEALIPNEEKEGNKLNEPEARYEVQESDKNEEYEAVKTNAKKSDNVIAIPNTDAGVLETNPISSNISMSTSAVNYSTAHTKKAIRSFRVWKLFTLVLCSYLGYNLLLCTWRPVGQRSNIPTERIQLIGSLNFIMTSIATPTYGFLSDKIPFRILFTFVSAVTSFIGFVFPFSLDNPNIYMLCVLGMNFNLGGYIAALPPHYMKVFGMKYYVEVGGIIGLANVIMGPICSFFAFFVENSCEDKLFAYKIIFISGAALNIVSLVLSVLEPDDAFDYGF